jgi:hypothetical protein
MTPETFSRELEIRMGPKYRLRRSAISPRWRIEQKISRAFDYPGNDDRAIMLRDGYYLVLDTPDGDTMRCPKCDSLIALPVFERAEFTCALCVSHGERKRLVDGYFPLVDKTLLYLERRHPRRGFEFSQEIERENRLLEKARRREATNFAEDLALDRWRDIASIPQFGYNSRLGTPNTWGR